MIHYQLRCGHGHGFDGWFASSAAFDRQATAGLVACPDCADTRVARALMAPSISTGAPAPAQPAEKAPEKPASETPAAPVAMPIPRLPDQMRMALRHLRAQVEARCDNVGDRFADEARKIHTGDAPARGIYGDATQAQVEALADDGIEVARLPWIPTDS